MDSIFDIAWGRKSRPDSFTADRHLRRLGGWPLRIFVAFLIFVGRANAGAVGPEDPSDGQWVRPANDLASTRFSPLSEITSANASRLVPAFTFSTRLKHGHEAAPLVVGKTMYVVTPFPNLLYALDLSKPGAPLKWKFDPHPDRAAQGVACCDTVNRGASYGDGKIVYNTLDGQTVAVNAETGTEVWRAHLGDIHRGETITMAPLIADGKVLVGNSGGEFGVRGWIAALNLSDGSLAWKAFNTGPDKDALIGAGFRPLYPQYRGKDMGVKSWPPGRWKYGGNTWGVDFIRSGSSPCLLRHRQSWSLESGPARGRQSLDCGSICTGRQHRPGALVLSMEPARSVRSRRHQ
jgi:glucose dehydrogenase